MLCSPSNLHCINHNKIRSQVFKYCTPVIKDFSVLFPLEYKLQMMFSHKCIHVQNATCMFQFVPLVEIYFPLQLFWGVAIMSFLYGYSISSNNSRG